MTSYVRAGQFPRLSFPAIEEWLASSNSDYVQELRFLGHVSDFCSRWRLLPEYIRVHVTTGPPLESHSAEHDQHQNTDIYLSKQPNGFYVESYIGSTLFLRLSGRVVW